MWKFPTHKHLARNTPRGSCVQPLPPARFRQVTHHSAAERGAEVIATTRAKRAEPRIPFGQVIERGMLRAGEELFSIGNRHKARVRADGSLIGNDVKGSIHQVGAALEGAPSCNGWTYWHFRREGKMIPLDILRQQIRAEMEGDTPRPN